jgi:uncharacterized protein (TIGR03435 family)
MRPLSLTIASLALVIATTHLFAQAPQTFDVVSIKPWVGGLLRVGIPTAAQVVAGTPPDRFDQRNVSLLSLITDAYERFPFEIVGGPDWMRSKSWEVSARASAPVSRTVMRDLVRRMLEDRFALKARVETRGDQPVFRLTLSRSDGRLGPKIKQAAMDCRPFLTGVRPMAESPKDAAGFPSCSEGVRREPADLFIPNGVFTPRLNGQPLSALVRRLEAMFRRRVIDDTGLMGLYDIEFSYPENAVQQALGTGADDVPSLSTLLQEQLGMKLVGARGPAEVLVIDSAQEPTPN